jgi:T5orf172 domain
MGDVADEPGRKTPSKSSLSPSDGTGFWSPISSQTMANNNDVKDEILRPIFKNDEKRGMVYVAKANRLPFAKVGFSREAANARVKAITTKCDICVEESHYHTPSFYCAQRAERIIHKLIREWSHKRMDCKCGHKNREWYRTEYDVVITSVRIVYLWMIQEPYDMKTKKLKPEWKGVLDRWDESQQTQAPLTWTEFFLLGLSLHSASQSSPRFSPPCQHRQSYFAVPAEPLNSPYSRPRHRSQGHSSDTVPGDASLERVPYTPTRPAGLRARTTSSNFPPSVGSYALSSPAFVRSASAIDSSFSDPKLTTGSTPKMKSGKSGNSNNGERCSAATDKSGKTVKPKKERRHPRIYKRTNAEEFNAGIAPSPGKVFVRNSEPTRKKATLGRWEFNHGAGREPTTVLTSTEQLNNSEADYVASSCDDNESTKPEGSTANEEWIDDEELIRQESAREYKELAQRSQDSASERRRIERKKKYSMSLEQAFAAVHISSNAEEELSPRGHEAALEIGGARRASGIRASG